MKRATRRTTLHDPVPATVAARRLATARAAIPLALLVAAGCATAAPPETPGPREPDERLPPIPRVEGALDLRVSYPRDSAFVATRGENFIFGSAGNAQARVWINDVAVDVRPNGGFLAFMPVPLDSVYRLRAELDGRVQTLEVPIRLPEPQPEAGDSAVILDGTVFPSGGWVALPGERIEIGFRGTAGGTASLVLPDGSRVPLVEGRDAGGGATEFEVSPGGDADPADAAARVGEPAFATYRGFFTARRLVSADTTVAWPALTEEVRPSLPLDTLFELRELEAGAPRDTARADTARAGRQDEGPLGVPLPGAPAVPRAGAADTVVTDAGDTVVVETTPLPGAGGGTGAYVELVAYGQVVRKRLPLNLLLADPARPRVGVGFDPDPPAENGDGAIIARPGPGGGPYDYTWDNGTALTLTGERNGVYRVRLAGDLDAWSPAGDIRLQPPGSPPPASRVSTVRLDPQPRYIDVHLAVDRRLPYQVAEGERSISLIVYGALSRVNFLQHGRVDPYIERAEWSQPTNDRFRLDIHLAGEPWGYEVFHGEGDDLVLRIRRPPAVDADAPLRGLTVGVDAGHGGADRFTMGPTGFTEADANLGIALALRRALVARGARVVMTRMTDTTVSLVERTELARNRDVDVWISVHNNAFPDGVNPWENNGTSVYYTHPRSAPLAWAVHRQLLAELGLRDLGVGRADLHQPRFTWAPAILTENAFMMIPEQEAALKRQDVQERIAEAHVRGLIDWLRGRLEGPAPRHGS